MPEEELSSHWVHFLPFQKMTYKYNSLITHLCFLSPYYGKRFFSVRQLNCRTESHLIKTELLLNFITRLLNPVRYIFLRKKCDNNKRSQETFPDESATLTIVILSSDNSILLFNVFYLIFEEKQLNKFIAVIIFADTEYCLRMIIKLICREEFNNLS